MFEIKLALAIIGIASAHRRRIFIPAGGLGGVGRMAAYTEAG